MSTIGLILEQPPPSTTDIDPDGEGSNPALMPETEAEKTMWQKKLQRAQESRKNEVSGKAREHKVPCFHPFDKKAFLRMSKQQISGQKINLKMEPCRGKGIR